MQNHPEKHGERTESGSLPKLLNGVLEEFGIRWSQLLVTLPAFISYFSLENYLNGGVWIGGTVISFFIVYPFRTWISHCFLTVVFMCVLAVFIADFILPIYLLRHFQWLPSSFDILSETAKIYNKIDTAFLSITIGIPFAVAVVSYRKQDDFVRLPLPQSVSTALYDSVTRSDFIFEKAIYKLAFELLDGSRVRMKCKSELHVRNRRRATATYVGRFDPAGLEKIFLKVSVNGDSRDHANPDDLTGRGFLLTEEMQPQEVIEVIVEFSSIYYARDTEFIGVYRPSREYNLHVSRLPDGMTLNHQNWLHRKTDLVLKKNGDRHLHYDFGLLPFQGVRLFWERSSS